MWWRCRRLAMRMRSVHSRRALAIHRSQIAFARGAWIGVLIIRMPAAVKTASNASVYLASRSLIRNFRPPVRSPRSMSVSGLLDRPCGGRVGGDAGQMDPAIVVLDNEQHIKPAEKDGVDVEEGRPLRSSWPGRTGTPSSWRPRGAARDRCRLP